jgi:hypothetical protein
MSLELGLMIAAISVAVAGIAAAILTFKIYIRDSGKNSLKERSDSTAVKNTKPRLEQGLMLSAVIVALGGIAAAIITYYIYDRDAKNGAKAFDLIGNRFDSIADRMSQQSRTMDSQFSKSLNGLDNLIDKATSAQRKTMSDLKRRLGRTFETIRDIHAAYSSAMAGPDNEANRIRLRDIANELFNITWQDLENPFLKKAPLLDSAFNKLHRTIKSLSFPIRDGYMYNYDELRSAIATALSQLRADIGMYYIDQDGTVRFDDPEGLRQLPNK